MMPGVPYEMEIWEPSSSDDEYDSDDHKKRARVNDDARRATRNERILDFIKSERVKDGDIKPDDEIVLELLKTDDSIWEIVKTMQEEVKEAKKVFEEITISPNYYRNQHWHMVQKDDEPPPEKSELQRLILQWPISLRDLYYGDNTNLLPKVVQIYSLKLISNDVDDQYSLHVFGQLRLLCSHSPSLGGFAPQVIFSRTRENCQTLTKKDPYLLLTGPVGHPTSPPKGDTCIEARLILKGTTESEDKYLTLSAACELYHDEIVRPDVSKCCKKGNPCLGVRDTDNDKHYWLEMTRSIVPYTIVATIDVQLADNSSQLQDEFLPGRCFFTAYASKDESLPCDNDMKVVLLDSRGDKVELYNRTFKLSRQTICVNNKPTESLMVNIELDGNAKELKFIPQYEGEVVKRADIGCCEIQVKVEWSTYWEKYLGRFMASLRDFGID